MDVPQATTALIRDYPRIFLACHLDHRRDPATDRPVSATLASILDHLDEIDGIPVSALARHMSVTPSTMSLNLDRLEAGGYIHRLDDPRDARRTLVRLTPAGTAVKNAQSILDEARVHALLQRLSPDERRRGLAGLALLARAADEIGRARWQGYSPDQPSSPAPEPPQDQAPPGPRSDKRPRRARP